MHLTLLERKTLTFYVTIELWYNLICREKSLWFLPNFSVSVTWPNQRQTKSVLKLSTNEKGENFKHWGNCDKGSKTSCTLLSSPLFTMTNVYQAFSYDHSIKYFWEPIITIQQRLFLFLWLVQRWLEALKWLGYCWLFHQQYRQTLFYIMVKLNYFFSNIISFLLFHRVIGLSYPTEINSVRS